MNEVIHLITTICMGGAEKQLLTLVREQIYSGREVSVIYLKGLPELKNQFAETGANIIDTFADRNPLIQMLGIRRFLSKKNNIVVHAHLPRAELLTFFLNKKVSIVLSRHNTEKFFPAAPSLISKFLSLLVSSKAKKIIAISAAVRDYLIEAKEIRKISKIVVVHYGYDPRTSNKEISDSKFPEVEDCGFLVGTIARLVPQKDLHTLLHAFSIFTKVEQKAKLIIIGEGYLRQNLVEYSSKLEISDKVIWVGRHENVSELLRKMNVFALTSIYEGFGLVLLEAMAERVPIVAARNSAIPEVLGDDYEGLFETGNSQMLAKLLVQMTDENKVMNLKDYLGKRIEKFQPNIMRIEIDQIYSQLELI